MFGSERNNKLKKKTVSLYTVFGQGLISDFYKNFDKCNSKKNVIHNRQVDRRVAGELFMAGPKYANVDASNSYSPMGDKRHGDIVMTGPVYPHVESSNKVFFFGVPHSATFIFIIFLYVIASIAYIHPVYGAGVQTHDLLIVSHLP